MLMAVSNGCGSADCRADNKLGITIMDLDRVNHIDLVVDGPDEVTRDFTASKGGGALLHEDCG